MTRPLRVSSRDPLEMARPALPNYADMRAIIVVDRCTHTKGSFGAAMTNLAYTLPFLGQGGVHLPFPQDATVRSRPGGWAYPDMLEVGNLKNATEDRTHFGASTNRQHAPLATY